MKRYKIEKKELEITVEIEGDRLKNAELHKALKQCREGSFDCLTNECHKLGSMPIEHMADRISLQRKAKPGTEIDQAAVAACLGHTIRKSEKKTEYCLSPYPKYETLKRPPMLLMLSVFLLTGQVSAEVITSEEAHTGLSTWEWREAGVSMQLVQRLPDQTRAFFQGRGFTSKDADIIGRACVFQTIFRNDGSEPMAYDMDEWHLSYSGQDYPIQTRERWAKKWQVEGVSQAARIAFHWSLLPTRQRFEPGDYNWGMTSFGLPPGESFDLTLSVTLNDNPVTRTIPGIVCALDQPGK